jgi:hypothetical protein
MATKKNNENNSSYGSSRVKDGRGKSNNNNSTLKGSAFVDPLGGSPDLLQSEEESQHVEEHSRKTTTRTFRIDEEMSLLMEKTARTSNTTQTSLLNDILVQYFTWSQYIINHDSPFVTFGSATLVGLQETVDDATLERIIKDISNEEATNFIRYRWRTVNFRNIVRYLNLLSVFANVGNIRIVRQNHDGDNGDNDPENNHDYNNSLPNGFERYEIAVRHHLGKRWSTFMALYISDLFISSIKGAEATHDVSKNSCFVNLQMPIRNSS